MMATWETTPACADVKIVSRDGAQVSVTPKRKKVALVGFATNSLHQVPWDDPEFEIWGLNQGAQNCKRRADRWFEMHSPEFTADLRDPAYIPWLRDLTIPVYMIEVQDEYPTSMRYPIEDAIHFAGRDYFTSSIAYMLALAAMEGFEEIHLYGINLAIGDEYFYEKPCAEWWLGLLEGKGIKVFVPRASSLLKQYLRYGYFVDARPNANLKVLLNSRVAQHRQECDVDTANVNFWNSRAIFCREIDKDRDDKALAEYLQPKLDEAETKRQEATNQFHLHRGQWSEAEGLIQVAEGIEHGADLVLIPAAPPAPTTS
jgi:hypothetical protein